MDRQPPHLVARQAGLTVQPGVGMPTNAWDTPAVLQERARDFDWCNCMACAAVPKPLLTEYDPPGRYFSSLTANVEHGWMSCGTLHHKKGSWHAPSVRIADPTRCLLLATKLATRQHSFCAQCEQYALDLEQWEIDDEQADAMSA